MVLAQISLFPAPQSPRAATALVSVPECALKPLAGRKSAATGLLRGEQAPAYGILRPVPWYWLDARLARFLEKFLYLLEKEVYTPKLDLRFPAFPVDAGQGSAGSRHARLCRTPCYSSFTLN